MKCKALFVTSLLISTFSVFSQTWQQSTSIEIQLGVRDKWGDKEYVAEFIVIGPAGKVSSAKIKVETDMFGYVMFPTDFNASSAAQGNYKWRAIVDGKSVSGGSFTFEGTKGGMRATVSY